MRSRVRRAGAVARSLSIAAAALVASATVAAFTSDADAQARRPRARTAAASADAPRPAPPAPKPLAQPLLTVVTVSDQKVRVYGAGADVLAQGPVSTGQEGYRTPTGIFSVIQKNRWHESNIYSGAPMPYMQRITWSGVAMHQGHLPGYPASHGCIRVPESFAKRFWEMTRIGVRVVVSPRETSAAPFSHERLPRPLLVAADAAAAPGPQGTVQLAAAGPLPGTPQPRLLNPLERAHELRAAAIKAEAEAMNAARDALELATQRSAEHHEASATLKAAQAALAAAQLEVQAYAQLAAAGGSGEGSAHNSEDAASALRELEDAEDRLAFARAEEQRKSDDAFAAVRAVRAAEAAAAKAAEDVRDANRRHEGLTVFISRREGRVFLRQGYQPVLDAPVAIRNPEEPIGTHVLVAMEAEAGGGALRWVAVSVPTSDGSAPVKVTARGSQKVNLPPSPPAFHSSLREALERIEIPAEASRVISERVWLGASLILSDFGISNETGKYTDIIVLTR
jgi:hypothetical protein